MRETMSPYTLVEATTATLDDAAGAAEELPQPASRATEAPTSSAVRRDGDVDMDPPGAVLIAPSR
jgi:hypothetical protein